jgi:hypothetical protein
MSEHRLHQQVLVKGIVVDCIVCTTNSLTLGEKEEEEEEEVVVVMMIILLHM